MLQITVTVCAFTLACIVILICTLCGVQIVDPEQFPVSNIAITTVIAVVVCAALIGFQIYKKKKAREMLEKMDEERKNSKSRGRSWEE